MDKSELHLAGHDHHDRVDPDTFLRQAYAAQQRGKARRTRHNLTLVELLLFFSVATAVCSMCLAVLSLVLR